MVVDMGYITRYHRKHYVKRSIRKDLYERLIKWCGEPGINICLEKALSILEPLKSIPVTKQEDKSKKARTWWWSQ
jgi:hypothetical protein